MEPDRLEARFIRNLCTTKSSHNGIFIGTPSFIEWNELEEILADLKSALDTFSAEEIVNALKRNVPTYHPERSMDKKVYNTVKN